MTDNRAGNLSSLEMDDAAPGPIADLAERPAGLRVIGLDLEYIQDYQLEFSRNAHLYRSLRAHVSSLERTSPVLSGVSKVANALSQFSPNLRRWRRNMNFNPGLFRKRSAIAERFLDAHKGQYDVILQTYLQFSPGTQPPAPYAVYMDATFAMGQKSSPDQHPLTQRERAEWLDMERAVYLGAGRLFPWSDFTARSLIEDYGCDPARVVAVGAGMNSVVNSLEHRRYDAPVALFVGMEFKRKGGMDVLQAFREVRRHLPKAELWIVGPRWPQALPQPGVRWLGRIHDRAKLAALYNQARLFVMPSFEPWGHVFCEAMGHGLACVALDCGPPSEIVQHGRTGLLVPQGDIQALKSAMLRLLTDRDLAERLGRNGHERAQSTFTWDHVIERMLPHLEAMVHDRVGQVQEARLQSTPGQE